VTLKATGRARLRVLLVVVVTLGALVVFLWTRVKRSDVEPAAIANRGAIATTSGSPAPAATTTPALTTPPAPSPTETPEAPESEPGLSNESNQPLREESSSFVGTVRLIIPVVGVRPEQLLDTFADARSEGRSHDAIDIAAPAGTPVVAASDGEIIKLFQSERGGTTIYQLSPDKRLVYYYAHLQRYADGIYPGKFVRQGEVIGYVGDTGNAGAGNYHLHFSIAALADPKRYWEGTNINPYPLLK
jgi:murein DD-endopeptidase MepM/ murein hydrolase activator NlpD